MDEGYKISHSTCRRCGGIFTEYLSESDASATGIDIAAAAQAEEALQSGLEPTAR
jgi:hypothetical protein